MEGHSTCYWTCIWSECTASTTNRIHNFVRHLQSSRGHNSDLLAMWTCTHCKVHIHSPTTISVIEHCNTHRKRKWTLHSAAEEGEGESEGEGETERGKEVETEREEEEDSEGEGEGERVGGDVEHSRRGNSEGEETPSAQGEVQLERDSGGGDSRHRGVAGKGQHTDGENTEEEEEEEEGRGGEGDYEYDSGNAGEYDDEHMDIFGGGFSEEENLESEAEYMNDEMFFQTKKVDLGADFMRDDLEVNHSELVTNLLTSCRNVHSLHPDIHAHLYEILSLYMLTLTSNITVKGLRFVLLLIVPLRVSLSFYKFYLPILHTMSCSEGAH
jgi:hypothetical protein